MWIVIVLPDCRFPFWIWTERQLLDCSHFRRQVPMWQVMWLTGHSRKSDGRGSPLPRENGDRGPHFHGGPQNFMIPAVYHCRRPWNFKLCLIVILCSTVLWRLVMSHYVSWCFKVSRCLESVSHSYSWCLKVSSNVSLFLIVSHSILIVYHYITWYLIMSQFLGHGVSVYQGVS